MLYRKIAKKIEEHLLSNTKEILLVDGARQVGKTYIIRYVGKKLFKNFIEINFLDDLSMDRNFSKINSINDFYFYLGSKYGNKLDKRENTLIFLDEVQVYPEFLTLLKFLADDARYTYICSGSQLGIALKETPSIPIGYINKIRMYPLDFEEFLIANNMSQDNISLVYNSFKEEKSLSDIMHERMMELFKRYLLIGGMPQAVNVFLESENITKVREVHKRIYSYYSQDASQYGGDRKLEIMRLYELIPSNLENKKKRVKVQEIENKKGKTFKDYENEFEYLISSGVCLDVKAVSNPIFPLIQSVAKNLLKLYLNDVGLLTNILYRTNIGAVLNDEKSINLGSVYESFVAEELSSHGNELYYYDNKNKGEVDFLINDYSSLSIVPIEVKSGKDYSVHSALNNFVTNDDYKCKKALVLSNKREVKRKGSIVYLPIYYTMFL